MTSPLKRILILLQCVAEFQNVFTQRTYTYQSYQKGITCSTTHQPQTPQTVSRLQHIIRVAESNNVTVRAVGSQHSISDNICTTGIPIYLKHFKQFSYNADRNTVTVGAGMEARDFLHLSNSSGCAFSGGPTFGGVTVGGILANGVHGTGIRYPTLLSDQLASLKFVDGRGELGYLQEGDPDFNAFRVSLGMLGIIYEAEFYCQKPYKLAMTNYPESDKAYLENNAERLINLVKSTDVVQAWWFPRNDKIILSYGNRTSADTPGTCQTNFIPETEAALTNTLSLTTESMQLANDRPGMFLMQTFFMYGLHACVPGRTPFYSEADGETPCMHDSKPAVGWSHKMMTSYCDGCAWKNEPLNLLPDDNNIAIPLSKLPDAARVLSRILMGTCIGFPLNGLYMRFLSPGKSLMGTNAKSGDDHDYWVSIEWITVPRWKPSQPKLGIHDFQKMAQALLQLGGRPHWGKGGLVYTSPDYLRNGYGNNLDEFINIAKKYDPNGRFMNTFGERVLKGEMQFTTTEEKQEYCGLNEVCTCDPRSNNPKECGIHHCATTRGSYGTQQEFIFSLCEPSMWEYAQAEAQGYVITRLMQKTQDLSFVIRELSKYGLFTKGEKCGFDKNSGNSLLVDH